jgi:hypothetical protein
MGDLCNFLELIINDPSRKNCLPKTGSARRAVMDFHLPLNDKKTMMGCLVRLCGILQKAG